MHIIYVYIRYIYIYIYVYMIYVCPHIVVIDGWGKKDGRIHILDTGHDAIENLKAVPGTAFRDPLGVFSTKFAGAKIPKHSDPKIPKKSLVVVCKYPSSWLDPPHLYETCQAGQPRYNTCNAAHQPQNLQQILCHSATVHGFSACNKTINQRCRTNEPFGISWFLSTWFWWFDSCCSKISSWNARNWSLPTPSWLLQEFKEIKFQGTYSMPKTSWAKHKGWQPKVLAFS